MNNQEIINSLRFVKWHIYCEFALFLLGLLSAFGLMSNPLVKLLFPKWLLLINLIWILAGTIWLGFLANKIRNIMKGLV